MQQYALAAALAAVLITPFAASAQRVPGGNAACRVDTATFCSGIEAGGGKKMRCLSDNLTKLSPECAAIVTARQDRRAALGGPKETQLAQNTQQNTQPPAPQVTPQAVPLPPATGSPPAIKAPVAAVPAAPGNAKRGNRAMANCRVDMATHCADVPTGGGARVQCLRQNQAKLSPECAAALSSVEQTRQDKNAENKQARNSCAADAQRLCADAKGPARRQCLDQNKAQLSTDCSASLEKRGDLRAKAKASATPTAPAASAPAAVPPPAPPKQ